MAAPGVVSKDTTFTKLFVGGLPYHTTDKTLKEHFDQYGEIEEAVVITDRSNNQSRGYGFVTMTDPENAKKAIADANPVIDGRKANVNLAYLGAKPRGAQAAALNTAAFIKPGLIAPQVGLPQFYMPGMIPGSAGIPISQLQLQQSLAAQISPTAQYPSFADYAAYGYPGLTGMEFSQAPAVSAAYAGLTAPGFASYSIPQTASGLTGIQFQPQLQQADTRLQ